MANKRTKKTTTRLEGTTTTIHEAMMVDPLYDTPPSRAVRPTEHPSVKRRAQVMENKTMKATNKPPAEVPVIEHEPEVEDYEGSGIDLPELDMEPAVADGPSDLDDQFPGAVQMAFIGAGQGGGRIAEAFHKLGYARVCVVNTTDQDLRALDVPGKLVIGNNRGGAGKDPESGKAAVAESAEDIMDLMMRCWGQGVEQVWICVGAGGGCISGDSLLFTTFCGVERLDVLYEKLKADYPVWRDPSGSFFIDTSELGVCTVGWSPAGFGLHPVARVWKHSVPREEQRAVRLTSGALVETSAKHPFARVRSGNVEWTRADVLNVGDVVLSGSSGEWPFKGNYTTLAGVQVDASVGWFLGAICGDGF